MDTGDERRIGTHNRLHCIMSIAAANQATKQTAIRAVAVTLKTTVSEEKRCENVPGAVLAQDWAHHVTESAVHRPVVLARAVACYRCRVPRVERKETSWWNFGSSGPLRA